MQRLEFEDPLLTSFFLAKQNSHFQFHIYVSLQRGDENVFRELIVSDFNDLQQKIENEFGLEPKDQLLYDGSTDQEINSSCQGYLMNETSVIVKKKVCGLTLCFCFRFFYHFCSFWNVTCLLVVIWRHSSYINGCVLRRISNLKSIVRSPTKCVL